MADPQTLIREAQEKAERLCRLAVAQTPTEYQSFITLIEQRKKVGGTRAAPIWAAVRQPYLSADGRIKMARDQHREAGKRFDIQSEFLVEPTSGQLLARATLTSEIYGTAVAHARVFLGGDGVNESRRRRGARARPERGPVPPGARAIRPPVPGHRRGAGLPGPVRAPGRGQRGVTGTQPDEAMTSTSPASAGRRTR
jgi:hypothetical protein